MNQGLKRAFDRKLEPWTYGVDVEEDQEGNQCQLESISILLSRALFCKASFGQLS
jgi:hypothetical protein